MLIMYPQGEKEYSNARQEENLYVYQDLDYTLETSSIDMCKLPWK